MTNVFISYARPNEKAATSAHQGLSNCKVKSFLDLVDLKKDKDLSDQIEKAINKCTHLVIVLSRSTFESKWVPLEIAYAKEKDKTIIVYQTSAFKEELPEYLQDLPRLKYQSSLLRYFGCKEPKNCVAR